MWFPKGAKSWAWSNESVCDAIQSPLSPKPHTHHAYFWHTPLALELTVALHGSDAKKHTTNMHSKQPKTLGTQHLQVRKCAYLHSFQAT